MISVQFLVTALVVVVSPGTGVLYTLAAGLGRGRRAALWAAAGCTMGIVPHLAAATLGLAAILHASALLFGIVKWAGVGYLLYLAWQSLRAGGVLAAEGDARARPGWRTALRGALINVLNPKLSIFFLALLPPFLSGDPARAVPEMALLGAVFMALTFAVFAMYGAFAAGARARVIGAPGAMLWLRRGFAAAFGGLAVRLAAERA